MMVNIYPNNLLVYGQNVLSPVISGSIFCILFYSRKVALRREIVHLILGWSLTFIVS